MISQSLTDGWKLREFPLEWDNNKILQVLNTKDGWLRADAPMDVYSVLMRHGIIKDPVINKHYEELEWIEKRSWWYSCRFDAPVQEIGPYGEALLVMEGLDCEADIFLNGAHIARHRSAFYPFAMNVADMLLDTGNVLMVRLTTGLDRVTDAMTGSCAYSVPVVHENRDDHRRLMLRKPQFVFGWDWSPRAASVGIMGPVSIQWRTSHVINHVRAVTNSIGSQAAVTVTIEAENLHPFASLDGTATVGISLDGQSVCHYSRDWFLQSGVNYMDFDCVIDDPRLWWPNGYGDQPLYDVTVTVEAGGHTEARELKIGLRTVELDTSALPSGGRRFAFVVNGAPIFCKGGNWIPADTVYGRITGERLASLVNKAAEANFNMLRVWGGGLYEPDAFYDACDAAGILVWHDFMFSCGLYPEDQDWFNREVEKELNFQTRRLASRACMALWCGNNENAWGFDEWYNKGPYGSRYAGAYFYNKLAPEAVRKNCPHIPYWCSSPYGGAKPNEEAAGDCHSWGDGWMNPELQKRITPEVFDNINAKFVSEYGVLGPCSLTAIKTYFDGGPIDMDSPVWRGHDNRNDKGTVLAGIAKHYKTLDLDDLAGYLLYGGLFQGLMYGYSLESLRQKPDCGGALFWMYNDAWGEIGWSIVDYAGIRKSAYYFVKRAFAPVKLIIREEGGNVTVTGVNDTSADRPVTLRYGVVSLDGGGRRETTVDTTLLAQSRSVSLSFPLLEYDPATAVCYVTTDDPDILPAVLRRTVTREMRLPEPGLTVTAMQWDGKDLRITVKSHGFAHGVHFPEAGEEAVFSDLWFDILPDCERTVVWYNAPIGLTAVTPASIMP